MSIQKLHPLEKTAIQARHTIKRLEAFLETSKDEKEKAVADEILNHFENIRKLIPNQFIDVDIKPKE